MFTLQLLGALDLRDIDGQPVRSVLAQPKRVAMLAYLAMHEGFCRRDALLPVFWPEQDQEHARAALRKVIYHLRQSLGDQVIVGRGDEEIALSEELIRCDGRDLRRALARGDAEQAVDAYTGELLPGFFLADVPNFECWLDSQRETLRRGVARGAGALAESAETTGDLGASIRWTRRQLEVTPADESALHRLLRLLERTGDRTGALAAFEHFALHLRLTYDLNPSAETRALVDRIRAPVVTAAAVQRDPVTPADLPAPREERPEAPTFERGPRPGVGTVVMERIRRPRWRNGALLMSLVLPAMLLLRAPILTIVEGAFGSLSQPADSPIDEQSIAVLPIADVGDGTDAEYLGVGMTDELINALGRVEGLRVASRTSTFALRDAASDVREVGRKLGVRYILEGSIRRDYDRVRLSIQLIDASDGRQRWAQSYDREMSDVLAMQEEVSRSVIEAIRGPLALRDPGAGEPRGTRDVEAYDQYLRGRFLLGQNNRESVDAAIRHFSSALERDPGYALAHAGLADAYLAQAEWFSPMTVLPKAKTAAVRALRLNDDLFETHLALAKLLLQFDWDWAGAEREHRRALELAPEVAAVHYDYAEFLWAARRFDEMIAEVRRGLELERREAADAVAFMAHERSRLSFALFRAHRYEEAIAMAESALELEPQSRARTSIVLASQSRGDFSRSAREMARGSRDRSVPGASSTAAVREYARSGRPEEGRRVLGEMLQRVRTEYVPKDQVAHLYLALGDTTEAIRWLEEAVEERHWFMVFWNADPFAEPLRSNPRFQKLMKRMNVPA